jgi:hypothetical protein
MNKLKCNANIDEVRTKLFSLMTGALQVLPADLKGQQAEDYCLKEKPYIYLICSRPKIRLLDINPGGNREMLIKFSRDDSVFPLVLGDPDIENIEFASDLPNAVKITFNTGFHSISPISVLFQKCLRSIIPEDILYRDGSLPMSLDNWDDRLFSYADLKIEYIGQGFAVGGAENAFHRHARGHEVHSQISGYNQKYEIDDELWIVFLPFDAQGAVTSMSPHGTSPILSAAKKLISRTKVPSKLDMRTRVDFTEAALIHYFKPQYNTKFKHNFPSKAHITYQGCYSDQFEHVAFELQTQNSLGCRVYTDLIKPKFLHLHTYDFNASSSYNDFLDIG